MESVPHCSMPNPYLLLLLLPASAFFAYSVHVHPQPFPVHRTLRYFGEENEYLKARFTLPGVPSPGNHTCTMLPSMPHPDPSFFPLDFASPHYALPTTFAAPGRFVLCPDRDVVLETNEHKVSWVIDVRVPPLVTK